jgi:hypothetical protein
MPTVRKGPKDLKSFPYTKKGQAQAEAYAKKHGGVVMNNMEEIENQKKDVLKNIAKAKGTKIPMRYEGYGMKDLPSEPEIMEKNYSSESKSKYPLKGGVPTTSKMIKGKSQPKYKMKKLKKLAKK